MISSRRPNSVWPVAIAAFLCMVLCTLASAETITITGTVLTPDGEPAAGATVFMTYSVKAAEFALHTDQTVAAEDGSFALQVDGERAFAYPNSIAACKPGFGVGCAWVSLQRTQGIEIALTREAVLTGIVKNAKNEPVPGANISLTMAAGTDVASGVVVNGLISTTTDTAGRFALGGLPVGERADLHISAAGYGGRDFLIWVPSGTEPAIVLEKEAVITGTVRRAGQPVGGIRVSCRIFPRMAGWPDDVTDDNGRYSLRGLPPGPYKVYIQSTNGLTAPAKYGVQCTPDQTLDGIDFDLIEGGLLSGTVTEAQSGKPLPGMTVTIHQSDTETSGYMQWRQETDANGHYSFRLAPGQYLISGAFSAEYYARGADLSQQTIEIVNGQTVEGIDLHAKPQPKMSGVVADEHGEPVANASVKQVPLGAPLVQSDQNGHFELLVPEPLPTEILARSGPGRLVGRVVVTDGDEEVQVRLQPEATVTGRVATPDGDGISEVLVKAEYEPEQGERGPAYPTPFTAPVASALSDENGRFELGLLPSDVAINVTILGDRRPYLKSSDWPENVVLQPGETTDLGTAVIDMKGRSITGRVMDAERELVPGCLVIDLFETDRFSSLFPGYSGTQARTDQLGCFELTGLPYHYPNPWATKLRPYEATLLAMHPELPLFAADARIDPDWGFETNLVLEPLGKVKGRLLDPEGRPMADHEVALGVSHMPPEPVNPRYYHELYERGARLQQKTVTDADGNWVFEGLIGALKYVVSARPRGSYQSLFHEWITPEPGQTIDLGDITAREPDQG